MLNCRLYSRLTTDLSEQQRLELGQRRGQPGRHYVPPVAVCAVAEADDLIRVGPVVRGRVRGRVRGQGQGSGSVVRVRVGVGVADDLAIVVHPLPPLLYGDVGPALLSNVHHGFE